MKKKFIWPLLFASCFLSRFAFAAPDSERITDLETKIETLQQQFQSSKTNPARDADVRSGNSSGISYKGVNIQLGGFLASETIYRNNNTASDIGTSYAKIPFANNAGFGSAEVRGTERQSRFSLLASGDYDSETHISGYYELDFLGTSPTANANESNSFTPRTRNVYMSIDWDSGLHLLAGQAWSLVTLNTKGITPRSEYIPPTIDAQYAVGFDWARQWQIRLTKDWSKTFWLALSAENAQTVGVSGTAATGTGNTYQLAAGSLMSNNLSLNTYPDVISKFAYESSFGHFEVYDLMRNIQSLYGGATLATQTNRQSDWTNAVGAGLTVPLLAKSFDLSLSGLIGQGIGRYGTGQLSDATYASDGSLTPLSGSQYLAQLIWHPSTQLDAYVLYGQEQVSANLGPVATFGYGDGAVTSNAGCASLGGTCAPNVKSLGQLNLGVWWSFYKGNFGAAKLGVEYSHLDLATYADKAGQNPTTKEEMLFTSLRFYPF